MRQNKTEQTSTEYQRFEEATRRILSVPKKDIDAKLAEEEAAKKLKPEPK